MKEKEGEKKDISQGKKAKKKDDEEDENRGWAEFFRVRATMHSVRLDACWLSVLVGGIN